MELLKHYFLDNYVLINFIFIIHIPSIVFSFLRVFYIFFYLYKLCLLKFNIISNVKSPTYDYFDNESRIGFFNFYQTYIEQSVFNFFHNFFYKNLDSKSNKIKRLLFYARDNVVLLILLLLLPSKHLIRMILFLFDIFWNFKKWRREAGAGTSSFTSSICLIIERKSSILFWINFTKNGVREQKIYIFNNKFTSNSWPNHLFRHFIRHEIRDLDYQKLLKQMCSAYKFNFCADYLDSEYPVLSFKREYIIKRDSSGRIVSTAPHYATRDFSLVAGSEFDGSYVMISHGTKSSNEKNDILKNFSPMHGSHLVLNSPSSMFVHSGPIESQIDRVIKGTFVIDGGIMLRREALGFLLKNHLGIPMTESESAFNPYVLLGKTDKEWVDEVFLQAKILIASGEASGLSPNESQLKAMQEQITVLFIAALNKRHVTDELFNKEDYIQRRFFKAFDHLVL